MPSARRIDIITCQRVDSVMIKAKKQQPGLSAEVADKSLLKQRAYAQLKQLIQDATFQPGDFLSERQLALRLGMSKTPVKAALERLEAEGFIAVAPQQGIVVRETSLQEIADQFEIRLALESFVLRAVAGKLKPEETQRVEQNLAEQLAAAERRDVPRSVELDAEFHMLFCGFHGNREIIRVMTQLREKIHRSISRVFTHNAVRFDDSQLEHRAIAEAVAAGDGDLAARRLEEHLNFGKQFLLEPRRR